MENPDKWQEIRKHFQQPNSQLATPIPHTKTPNPRATTHDTPNLFKHAMREIKGALIVVAFFSLIINLLVLVSPIYMMQVYDRVLSSGSVPTLFYLTVAAVALMLISALLIGARSRILARLSGRFHDRLSGLLFTRVIEQNLQGKKGCSLGDLDTLRSFLTGSGLFFFFDAPWTPLFLAVMLLLHPLLFLVALGGAVILFLIAVTSELVTRRALNEASQHIRSAAQFATEVSEKVDTVEAMGMTPKLSEHWQHQYQNGLSLQALANDRNGILTAATRFIRPVLQVAILGVGAYLVLQQQISAGSMLAASLLMGRALAPVEGAISNWRSFVLARAAYARIKKTLLAPGRKHPGLQLPKPNGNISVEQLVGAAPGSQIPIIRGVSFKLDKGEALGIVGPSASGKSTLARFLVGVWSPVSGCSRLDGADVSSWNRSDLGPYIGYMSQSVELFDGTIAENIARFNPEDSETIIAAAKEAGVHEMILQLPGGYSTQVGPGGLVLSGGQRQRIGLARAIYGQPPLVVLDEPNSNLDDQGERTLAQTLNTLKQRGATLIVITHRPSILTAVDKILVLREGTTQQFGPAEEIMQSFYRSAQNRRAAHEVQQPDSDSANSNLLAAANRIGTN